MRVPELPLEPVVRADVVIGPYGEAPEDEDRIHELVKRANEYIEKRHNPQFVGPSAELMPEDAETRAAPPADKSRPYRRGEQHG